MTKLGVLFDEYDLSSKITVLEGFSREIISDRQPIVQAIDRVAGEKFKYQKKGSGVITVPFFIKENIVENRRELAKILDVDEPKRLVFSDEPDKYYLVILNKSIDFDDYRDYGKGKISFFSPGWLGSLNQYKNSHFY